MPECRSISWMEMCTRVKGLMFAQALDGKGLVIELKSKSDSPQRGKLIGFEEIVAATSRRIGVIGIKCLKYAKWQGGRWVGLGYNEFDITLGADATSPQAAEDGKIVFTVGHSNVTIYPPGSSVDCP